MSGLSLMTMNRREDGMTVEEKNEALLEVIIKIRMKAAKGYMDPEEVEEVFKQCAKATKELA